MSVKKSICADRHHSGQEVKRPQCYYCYSGPYVEIVVFSPPQCFMSSMWMCFIITFCHNNNNSMFTSCNFCIFFSALDKTSWHEVSKNRNTQNVWLIKDDSKKRSRNINSYRVCVSFKLHYETITFIFLHTFSWRLDLRLCFFSCVCMFLFPWQLDKLFLTMNFNMHSLEICLLFYFN